MKNCRLALLSSPSVHAYCLAVIIQCLQYFLCDWPGTSAQISSFRFYNVRFMSVSCYGMTAKKLAFSEADLPWCHLYFFHQRKESVIWTGQTVLYCAVSVLWVHYFQHTDYFHMGMLHNGTSCYSRTCTNHFDMVSHMDICIKGWYGLFLFSYLLSIFAYIFCAHFLCKRSVT